jgi:LPS-assembly protein
VARLRLSPNERYSFITRGRFDQDDFSLRRLEIGATANFAPTFPLSASLVYARYGAQPEIGFDRRREGVIGSAKWELTPNWFVTGSVLLDLDRYLKARDQFINAYTANPTTAVYNRQSSAYVSALTLGVGYIDECTTFTVSYSMSPRDISVTSGEKNRNQLVMFTLELRTLGQISGSQNIGAQASQEGVATR